MEQTGEMGEIGREARHEGGKDEEFRVQVHNHICPRLQV
jgi:hypothetical protein